MKNNSNILTLICFGIILLSMFLPFYEGPRAHSLIPKDSFTVNEVYFSSEFGLGLWVFNGFGSFFALANLPAAAVLVLSRYFFPKSLITAILTAMVFLVSLSFLIYENAHSHEALTDEMLIGFYLMLVSQVVLITQAFTKAITEPGKERKSDPNLLDF